MYVIIYLFKDGTIENLMVHNVYGLNTFYGPSNSTPLVFSFIENTIDLAFNLGIQGVIIIGDFNLDMTKNASRSKVKHIVQRYSMAHMISEAINFTEHFISLIDLFLVSNPQNGNIYNAQICTFPIVCSFKYSKPCSSSYKNVFGSMTKVTSTNYDVNGCITQLDCTYAGGKECTTTPSYQTSTAVELPTNDYSQTFFDVLNKALLKILVRMEELQTS
ncbi:hypothetical protein MAR_026793 [Mya arenaria]|uniref:Endonuclease/exonuclease/phosphatase domain-containing protein n=1 Tax=Mya arenaria TaxID=6604 RepID=A0ABY7ERM9_MYAAR|nr:hypothetical protein MAR_026793 [Mya arenaria]